MDAASLDVGADVVVTISRLTDIERRDLDRLESDVEIGMAHFRKAGMALSEISERKLYRERYRTFNDYCIDRWGIARSRAYQLIDAAKITESMSLTMSTPGGHPSPTILPATEKQCRELGKIADPDERVDLWEEAVEESGGKQPTAARLAELIERSRAGLSAEAYAQLAADEEREAMREASRLDRERKDFDRREAKKRLRLRVREAVGIAKRLGEEYEAIHESLTTVMGMIEETEN